MQSAAGGAGPKPSRCPPGAPAPQAREPAGHGRPLAPARPGREGPSAARSRDRPAPAHRHAAAAPAPRPASASASAPARPPAAKAAAPRAPSSRPGGCSPAPARTGGADGTAPSLTPYLELPRLASLTGYGAGPALKGAGSRGEPRQRLKGQRPAALRPLSEPGAPAGAQRRVQGTALSCSALSSKRCRSGDRRRCL